MAHADTAQEYRSLKSEEWGLKETMPFRVASDYTGQIQVSVAFTALFGNVIEAHNLKSSWNNGRLCSLVTDGPQDTRWFMKKVQADTLDFSMMSLCATHELIMRQPNGGPGRFVTDGINLIFVKNTGNFAQINNSPHNYDTIVKLGPVALVVIWDARLELWFVDVQSVQNPRIWATGTAVHFMYFDGL